MLAKLGDGFQGALLDGLRVAVGVLQQLVDVGPGRAACAGHIQPIGVAFGYLTHLFGVIHPHQVDGILDAAGVGEGFRGQAVLGQLRLAVDQLGFVFLALLVNLIGHLRAGDRHPQQVSLHHALHGAPVVIRAGVASSATRCVGRDAMRFFGRQLTIRHAWLGR